MLLVRKPVPERPCRLATVPPGPNPVQKARAQRDVRKSRTKLRIAKLNLAILNPAFSVGFPFGAGPQKYPGAQVVC
jgi:hypothetical protein